MDASVLAAYDPGKIPEISKKIGGLFSAKSDKNPQGLGINGTDDYPSDDYLDFSKVTYIYSEDGKFRTPVIPTKMEKIANGSKVLLTSQAEGYLSDPSTAQVVWQNLLAQKGDPAALKINPSGGGFISADDKELFIQRYVEKAKDFVKPFKYGKMEPVPVVKTTTTKEGAAQAKIEQKAKNITDDILRANSKKNTGFFVGKTIKGGKEIQSAKWEGDNLVLTTIDTSGSNSFEEQTVYNMNRIESVENIVADFVKERYGKDASSENIRDAAIQMLRERQEDGKPKINTSYKTN
jgi:translation elongation factor P/translation initiation factor 5A